jgi:hypothetical protein
LLASRKKIGRLQRAARKAFIFHRGAPLHSSALAEWAFGRQVLIERRPLSRAQCLSLARAIKSIGGQRVRREGRSWIWRLPEDVMPRWR